MSITFPQSIAIDTIEFDFVDCDDPSIIHVSGYVYAIVYDGPDNDGFLQTIEIRPYGSIVTLIDLLEFDDQDGREPILIHISEDIYAVAYRGSGNDGFLKTVNISSDGTIYGLIDMLEFDTSYGATPRIIHTSGAVYAIVYEGQGNDGFLKTVEISDEGLITDSTNILEFDTQDGREPDITHITGNVYAIVYGGFQGDGFIITVQIFDDGSISGIVDALEFETDKCDNPVIIHISGETYTVAYTGPANDGFLKSLQISSDGSITDSTNMLEFDDQDGREPVIIQVEGETFAIAYRGSGNDGFLKTVKIESDGQITDSINIYEFEDEDCYGPNIIHVYENIFAIVYEGPSAIGRLKTLEIENDGNIIDAFIDVTEFDAIKGEESDIITVNKAIYAVVYRGPDNDGFIKTYNINDNGSISEINLLEFDDSSCSRPQIAHVSNSIYAVVYTGTGNDGYIKTIKISSYGALIEIIDTLEYESSNGINPSIIQLQTNIYAIVYTGSGGDGFLKTIEISDNGEIIGVIDSLEFDEQDCDDPKIIHLIGSKYVIVYNGVDGDGFLKTIEFSDGIIQNVIDTFEFDINNGAEPDIFKTSDNIYAIAYRGLDGDGFLKTVQIDLDGTIFGIIDTLEFDSSGGSEPNLIHVNENLYLIAYKGPGNDGFFKAVIINNDGYITDTENIFEFDIDNCQRPNIIPVSENIYAISYEGPADKGLLRAVYPLCGVGDLVFFDLNKNGIWDPAEPGIKGLNVGMDYAGSDKTFETGDDEKLTQSTDDNGEYRFLYLLAGKYQIKMDENTTPPGTELTTSNEVVKLDLDIGEQYYNAYFGFAGSSSICGTIWIDTDQDGNIDVGEEFLEGITISLFWSGLDNVILTYDDLIFSTATNSQGKYCFTNLPSGNYRLQADYSEFPSAGLTTSNPDIILSAGENLENLNLGLGFTPVGGYILPLCKLNLLIPYLSLAGLILVVSTVYVIKRRKD